MKSAKAYRKELAEKGSFYTDPKLAEMMKAMLPVDIENVYDPTCGSGNLLAAFPDSVKKYGQEIDEATAMEAQAWLVNADIRIGDTLKDDKFIGYDAAGHPMNKMVFDAIIANPPFSIKWEPDASDPRFSEAPTTAPPSRADWAFLLHCLYHLHYSGVCIALCFPGILYRGGREQEIRKWFVEKGYIRKVIAIEGGYFEDTQIATDILEIAAYPNGADGITFIDHQRGIEYLATRDEIAAQDYNLSPSSYIPPEKPKEEPFDRLANQEQIKRSALKQLDATYELFAITDELEHEDGAGAFLRSVENWLKQKNKRMQEKKMPWKQPELF